MANVKKKKGVVRGRSTAFLVTVGLHAVLLIGAVFYTAMTVLQREEPKFEGTKIERPKMDLKKLQVPVKVKKIRQPKFNVSAPTKSPAMSVNMPSIGKIGGGVEAMGSGLGSLGFSMRFDTLFGGDAGSGGELVGTFYDLKQKPNRMPVTMDDPRYCATLKTFFESNWDEDLLEEFFQAPGKKFATAFMMPTMDAKTAPENFGVADVVEPKHWVIHYKGEFAAPETGRYRFVGLADDVLVVRVGRDIVLDASMLSYAGKRIEGSGDATVYAGSSKRITEWESDTPETGLFPMETGLATYGDWIPLKKGNAVPIEILIGEMPGGSFSCNLLIEQEGATYKQITVRPKKEPRRFYPGGERLILPVFKMAPIPEGLKSKMKLNPGYATFEGPIFGTRR
jgi:hypothetical protein